ncbi:MAG: glycosyltransferase family 4 protein [Chitinophagales bacterium]|nr:glycosyltransferase family 4 protein [Chitinophagales bacterium]
MKKIGIIANTSWNILNFRLGLIHALKQAGHQIIIIAPNDEHSAELDRLGFNIQYVKGLSRKGTNPLIDLLLIFELAKIYRQSKLDIVLQYTIKPNIYGSIAGFLTRIKTISTVTGLGYVFLNNGLSSSIAKILYKIAFKFSHLVYFQNADDKALFEQSGLVSIRKSRLVNGSGIDTDFYHPNYCDSIPKNSGVTTFLMIARLLKDKGVYEYITAAKNIAIKYSDTRFILLGDTDIGNPAAVPEKDIELWKEENIIEILGFKKNTRYYICQADAVVLPSYREGIPRVILEAFAMGKPCITTDAPGCRHTVDHTINGLICKVADAKDLENKIEEFILMNVEEKRKMGENARYKALNTYSIDFIAKEYLTLLDSL